MIRAIRGFDEPLSPEVFDESSDPELQPSRVSQPHKPKQSKLPSRIDREGEVCDMTVALNAGMWEESWEQTNRVV